MRERISAKHAEIESKKLRAKLDESTLLYESSKESLKLQAENEYDSRQLSVTDLITQVIQSLPDRVLHEDLVRELCAQKIQVQKSKKVANANESLISGLQAQLRQAKNEVAEHQAKALKL